MIAFILRHWYDHLLSLKSLTPASTLYFDGKTDFSVKQLNWFVDLTEKTRQDLH